MYRITHIRTDVYGDISHARLNNGAIVNYAEAFDLAKEGLLEDVSDSSNGYGYPTIESVTEDNLKHLPSF